MPGQIAEVTVSAGDTVERGQLLCKLEAMKMKNQIRAPKGGRIEAVHVSVGEQVQYGDPLVTYES